MPTVPRVSTSVPFIIMHLQIPMSDVEADKQGNDLVSQNDPTLQDEKTTEYIATEHVSNTWVSAEKMMVSEECTSDKDDTSEMVYSGGRKLKSLIARACKSDHVYMCMYVICSVFTFVYTSCM